MAGRNNFNYNNQEISLTLQSVIMVNSKYPSISIVVARVTERDSWISNYSRDREQCNRKFIKDIEDKHNHLVN